jgi:hypothetical protein
MGIEGVGADTDVSYMDGSEQVWLTRGSVAVGSISNQTTYTNETIPANCQKVIHKEFTVSVSTLLTVSAGAKLVVWS